MKNSTSQFSLLWPLQPVKNTAFVVSFNVTEGDCSPITHGNSSTVPLCKGEVHIRMCEAHR